MTLVLLNEPDQPLVVERVPEGETRREHRLRDLIFANPEMLPVRELDPGLGRLRVIARELNVPGVGFIDVMLVDENGRLVIVECKLWRNPQARREVVGQIIDYARELARYSYDDLQREISRATGRSGNVLYELAREAGGQMEEARFVDRVSRDLGAGRFWLLIVGDGITEGTFRIGEYLRAQPGLAFDFGLVEMAEYRFIDPAMGIARSIIQPRVLARTVVIERGVIRSEVPGLVITDSVAPVSPAPSPGQRQPSEMHQNWRSFAERFIAQTRFDDPGQPPPRIGGLNWMRVPLPGPSPLVIWRSNGSAECGAQIKFTGAEGLAARTALEEDRDAIGHEFEAAGLPPPEWRQTEQEGIIVVTMPAPLPWDAAHEDEQIRALSALGNQFVNSLRPRLIRLSELV